jgi:hypothetical protein
MRIFKVKGSVDVGSHTFHMEVCDRPQAQQNSVTKAIAWFCAGETSNAGPI